MAALAAFDQERSAGLAPGRESQEFLYVDVYETANSAPRPNALSAKDAGRRVLIARPEQLQDHHPAEDLVAPCQFRNAC